MKIEVADILRRFGPLYLQRFSRSMLGSHKKAIYDIQRCRTEAMGGHVYHCQDCGKKVYVYHACRNRHCPACHSDQIQKWLNRRTEELLPCDYFHVTVTVPQTLRSMFRSHQKLMYSLLMKTASESVIQLADDPKHLGGRVGILAVLHTWTRTLLYHPHVHCLVPAGGVSDDQEWLPARKNYLVPVKALSKIFRGMFRDMVPKELPALMIPKVAWIKEWVVYCKPALQGADKVLAYLGRYVYRIAISNSRILSIEDGKVTFRYQQCGDSQWKTMTLPANEFMRRFLQHVLPKGTHKVRYYGLWSPANRSRLHQLQILLARDKPVPPHERNFPEEEILAIPLSAEKTCPHCGKGLLVLIDRIPRQGRAPP